MFMTNMTICSIMLIMMLIIKKHHVFDIFEILGNCRYS